MRLLSCSLLAMAACLWSPAAARAHFIWVVTQPEERPASAQIYFGEDASPDDPELLDRIAAAKAWALPGRGEPKELALTKGEDALVAEIPADQKSSTVVLRHAYGVLDRGGETFLLSYYAKTYPSSLPGTWRAVDNAELLPLEVVPELKEGELALKVLWQGKPLPGAEIVVGGPGLKEDLKGTADADGMFQAQLPASGLYSIRAKHVESAEGEHEGSAYDSARHYSTLALHFAPPSLRPTQHSLPELPKGVTSFGGAVDGDWLYVYGGHYGEAHHYSRDGQSGDFYRLNLRDPGRWEQLPGGPKRTGTALVAHGGALYRAGGFEARNAEDEEQSLWSMADVQRFDPAAGRWEDLPPLPEGRSSHDAALVGDTLYVVGGWDMRGDEETVWHDTAWSMDLAAKTPEWKPVANPPFHRRAVALAEWNGKLLCLGGMREQGGPTTETAVFDPASGEWSEAPALLGGPMDGFGSSAFACGGRLYATTMSGSVQRLSDAGDRWEFVGQLDHPRFFHRLLPWQDSRLVVVGGASMATGKIQELELIPVGGERVSSR